MITRNGWSRWAKPAAPNSPAIEADFHGLGQYLASHPHSQQLADFITKHPALASVFAPAAAHTAGHGYAMGAVTVDAFGRQIRLVTADDVRRKKLMVDARFFHLATRIAACQAMSVAERNFFGTQLASWRQFYCGSSDQGCPEPDVSIFNAGTQIDQVEAYDRVADTWVHRLMGYACHEPRAAITAGNYTGWQPAPPNLGNRPPPPNFGNRRPPPPQVNTWNRWQQVHPGTSHQDYANWWQQYGQHGAQIN